MTLVFSWLYNSLTSNPGFAGSSPRNIRFLYPVVASICWLVRRERRGQRWRGGCGMTAVNHCTYLFRRPTEPCQTLEQSCITPKDGRKQ